MREISINIQGVGMDFRQAAKVAKSIATLFDQEPTLVSWHDGKRKIMSPAIEGADVFTRWRDYGESMGGDVEVAVNGDYDFIFADTRNFETLGPSPYISLQDSEGHMYLCLPEHLRDASNPTEEACIRIDEPKRSPSALHEG